MLNIINHQRNVNQTRYHFTLVWMTIIKKKWKIQYYGETGTLVHCWQDCKMVWLLWKSLVVLRKFNKELPYNLAIPLPRYLPRAAKAGTPVATFVHPCTQQHSSQKAETTQCPPTDKWMDKVWHAHTHRHTGVLFSHKKNEILIHATTWMHFAYIMQSEISQIQTNIL